MRFFLSFIGFFLFCLPILNAQDNTTQLAQVVIASPPPAQVESPKPVDPIFKPAVIGMEGVVTLELRNIDVVDALKYLTQKVGVNIITNKTVTGRITLNVNNASVKDIFDIMLRSNNLAFDKKGDIYNVMTQEEYRALYGRTFSDVRQVKVFKLNYAIPEQAFSFLDVLKSEIGRVLVDPESGNVLIMDSPEKIEIMIKALDGFEQKNVVKVIRINYASAKDIEDALKTQLDKKQVGLVKANEATNQLLIQTLPERMAQIEEIIQYLDQKTREIIIDTQIIKINLVDNITSGVQWEGLFDISRSGSDALTYLGAYPFSTVAAADAAWASRQTTFNSVGYVGSYPSTGYTSAYSTGQQSVGTGEMHLGLVGQHDVNFIIKYLKTIGNTRILSNPKLVVVDNKEAKIHVGQKEAYVTTTTTTGSATNTISEQVTFVDTGVLLSVVPNINQFGYITLKVRSEVNSVIGTLVTPSLNMIPILDTSLAETTVMVKDGTTIVIGGLRKERDVDSIIKVPILGSLPFIGKLFSMTTKTKEHSELMIILTPKIISGDVLIASVHGKGAGKSDFKHIKDYEEADIKEGKSVYESESSVFVPLGKKTLSIKRAKVK
ncbi:MAG: secretin N-terminal domain-containing protein [Candidatus Omnitrophota bacterium]